MFLLSQHVKMLPNCINKSLKSHPIHGLIHGMYSTFVPIFSYAIFGILKTTCYWTCHFLVSNVLSNIVDSNDELYTKLAILLVLMVGTHVEVR